MNFILMGVAGCGKTTIGELLAQFLGQPFLDGDDFHPEENKLKMSRGDPLNDSDRLPWLQNIRNFVDANEPVIIACSALKKSYRDILRSGKADVRFVFLDGNQDLISKRLDARKEHFFPPGLLQSQFDTLEFPHESESDILTVSIVPGAKEVVQNIASLIKLHAKL